MNRRFGSGKLSKNTPMPEDINPMDGVANLADVMLVLACGLMLALIINWNVDIGGTVGSTVSVNQGQEVSELQGLTGSEGEQLNDETQYEKMGVVYKDPVTGKLYMVTTDEDKG
jgi:hypothetical protein